MYYLILWLAVLLGQFFISTIVVWFYQRKNPNIDYFPALGLYYKKEVGKYMVIFATTLILTFVLSNWADLTLTKADLMSKVELNRFETAQKKFRTVATFYGMVAELVAILFYKVGKNAVIDFGKSKGIDLNDSTL